MAFPTVVNSQITDSVTQSNVKVVGETPAQAEGELFQTMAESTGTSMEGGAPPASATE
ncbi:RebB family R body protein [Nitrospirillum pindoramense]|uniref:Killing trait domain-containing protein n=1 Tax=Nitrospirillum amazonense TaxID=28077 RepID=A0A560GUF5_9PROT|nr:killing trait domain-containing protein [Nitrospirillum amazonense]